MFISLYTKNCIVTGKPAKLFTGHVIMSFCGEDMPVIAGFEDRAVMNSVSNLDGKSGYFGKWNPTHGLRIEYWDYNNNVRGKMETGEFTIEDIGVG